MYMKEKVPVKSIFIVSSLNKFWRKYLETKRAFFWQKYIKGFLPKQIVKQLLIIKSSKALHCFHHYRLTYLKSNGAGFWVEFLMEFVKVWSGCRIIIGNLLINRGNSLMHSLSSFNFYHDHFSALLTIFLFWNSRDLCCSPWACRYWYTKFTTQ